MRVYKYGEFINESLKIDEYYFFIKTGLSKEWIREIENAYNTVPEQAKPTCICGFNRFKSITGRGDVINKLTSNNYGVTMNLPSIELPIDLMPESYKEKLKERGMFNDRIYEIAKTFKLDDMFTNSSISIVSFNNKFLSPIEINARKVIANNLYKEKNGNDYFINFTGIGTIYHEFGHVFDNRMYISNKEEWLALSKRWHFECNCDLIKNPSEAFGEAFANYYSNNSIDLPDYIVEFLKKCI